MAGGMKITNASGGVLSVFPVGAIYMSTVNTNPSTWFGGTWEQIQNRFLLAAGSSYTAGNTGGEATHVLTPAETATKGHTHSYSKADATTKTAGAHTHTSPLGWDINHLYLHKNNGNTDDCTGATVTDSYHHQVNYAAKNIKGLNRYDCPTSSNGGHTHTLTFTSTASAKTTDANGSAHNNMPPYLVVYMWKRTA